MKKEVSQLRLQLLGGFVLQLGQERLGFVRRKAESLIAFLALHPGAHPRERMADVLWPDVSASDARLSLRVALADIAKSFGRAGLPSPIDTDPQSGTLAGARDALGLNRLAFGAGADVWEFQRLAALPETASDAPLQAALNVYTSDLMPQANDAWLHDIRQKLQRQHHALMHRLLQRHRDAANLPAAIALARRAIERDALDEKAHQHLIYCLAVSGEREAALLHFEDCQRQFEAEGLALGEDTTALYQRLKKQASSAVRLSNLPRPATSFVGREDELNEVETQLTQTRMLTLLGSGGSGKTRLAMQAAEEVAFGYEGGVWWVDLAPLADASRVAHAVASGLGVKETPGKDLLDALVAHIGAQRMLLLLDTCERVLQGAAHCAERLLAACPSLTVLATSREPLGLPGETRWQTPALETPAANSRIDWAEAQHNDAVRLFAERVRQIDASFKLHEGNVLPIVAICQRVQGIALAVELAAAQAAEVGVDALAQHMDKARAGANPSANSAQASAPTRHQTLQATIGWSYDMLAPHEQALLRRLAVFSGGWTLELATEIAAGYPDAQAMMSSAQTSALPPIELTPQMATAHLLGTLVNRALVQQRPGGQHMRYAMLDSVVEFGRAQMQSLGEWDGACRAHVAGFVGLAEAIEPRILGSESAKLGQLLAAEQANFEAALLWTQTHAQLHLHWRLLRALSQHWVNVSELSMGERWLQPTTAVTAAALDAAQVPTRLQAEVLTWACDSLYRFSQGEKIFEPVSRAIVLFEALHDSAGTARAIAQRGMAHWLLGAHERAFEDCLASLVQYRLLPIEIGRLRTAIHVAEIARVQQRHDDALAYNQEALEVAQALGNRRGESIALLNMGLVAVNAGRLSLGCQWLQHAGRVYVEVGEKHGWVYVLQGMGQAAQMRGDRTEAARLYGMLHAFQAASGFALFGPDLPPHEARAAQLKASMPAHEHDTAWQSGAGLSVPDIVAQVLAMAFEGAAAGT